ncbi:uncharacterized protein LOC144432012 [Styela clava]
MVDGCVRTLGAAPFIYPTCLEILRQIKQIIGKVASDWQCTRIGGTCKDYTQNTCIAGYLTGKCSGNNDRRCCKACSHSCESNESSYSSRDGTCDTARGKCQHNSNYCEFPYQSGKCGGPSARQCCVGWNIHDMETTGASAKTAEQDRLSYYGNKNFTLNLFGMKKCNHCLYVRLPSFFLKYVFY